MFSEGFLKEIASGMKGNADALLAFVSLVAVIFLFSKGVPYWAALGGPLLFFVLYVALRLVQNSQTVRMKEIEFDREKESNRVELERRKAKALR